MMDFPTPGDLFEGKYELERILGEGGFARVFKGREISLGRPVALKVLKPGADGYPAQIKARFDREVRVIANLSDPHTVTLFDWGESEGGLLYLVFEFVDGRDLNDIIKDEGPLPEQAVIKILRQILKSLREAHDVGLLHRDIKPHNIRIYEYAGDPLCAKLLDFGIAKPTIGADAITSKGVLVGSPRYMAPEALFNQELGPSSDLYSLGLVAREMLLGRDAMHGASLQDQLDRLSSDDALRIADDVPISRHMRDVVESMVAYEPQRRFQSAAAVLAALGESQTTPIAPFVEVPTLPRSAGLDEESRPTTKLERPHSEPTLERPPREDRKLYAIAAITVAATIVAGWVIVEQLQRDDPPRAPDVVRRPRIETPPRVVPPPTADLGSELPGEPTPLDGCGQDPPFRGRGEMRSVDILDSVAWSAYIPRSYDPSKRHRVLMLFHEDLESSDYSLDTTRFDDYAETRGVVILMPRDPAIRAWRSVEQVTVARRILDHSAEQLCLETGGVFAFGHGTGGRAVERLHCVVEVHAAAASSHRPELSEQFCKPARPQPFLLVAPLGDGYDPVEGGSDCGAAKISLHDFEKRWRDRNRCADDERPKRRKVDGGTCFEHRCVGAPFVSCHAKGGHRWPGQAARGADIQNCDGGMMSLPIADIVWEFFDTFSG